MATKIDQQAIRISEIFDIRLEVKGSDKESYTKEELLDLLDEMAAKVKAETE